MRFFLPDPPFQYLVSGKKRIWEKKMRYFLAEKEAGIGDHDPPLQTLLQRPLKFQSQDCWQRI